MISNKRLSHLQTQVVESNDHYQKKDNDTESGNQTVKAWPIITKQEIAKHKTLETGMWVYYKISVFDVTSFYKQHPGGSHNIKIAAGKGLEPFFSKYRLHYEPRILNLLNKYKIGELPLEQMSKFDDSLTPGTYQHIQSRTTMGIVVQTYPFCCETNPKLLLRSFLTPIQEAYVRCHNKTPEIKEAEHQIDFYQEGASQPFKSLKMEDIKKIKPHEVMVCWYCAGNRRSEFTVLRPDIIRGVNFGPYAFANGIIKGPLVIDVLQYMGINLDSVKHMHLATMGADSDINDPMENSIPMSYVLDPRNEVIFAYSINGVPLPEDHGFPIRLQIPGFLGLRNTKWLKKVTFLEKETQNRFLQKSYKPYKEIDWDHADPSKYLPPMQHKINAVIAEPIRGEIIKCTVENPFINVRGIAVGDGKGARIVKVEVSGDNGNSWNQAMIVQREQKDESQKCFSWVHWQYELKVSNPVKTRQNQSILVRAYDSHGNKMDKSVEEQFNLSGVMNNAPHEVEIKYFA